MRFFLLFTATLILAFPATRSDADTVCFHFSGTADLTLNGVFHTGEAFTIDACIDDTEADQFPFQDGRGAFGGATAVLTLADPTLMIQNQTSTNINGITQDGFQNAIFLVEDTNFNNPAFSSIFTMPSPIVDVNSINPLSISPVNANSNGSGVIWDFAGGETVQFNTVSSLTVENGSSVPEPSAAVFFILFGLGLSTRRRSAA